MNGSVEIDIQVAPTVVTSPDDTEIRLWLERAVSMADGPAADQIEISLRVVDEEEGRLLNRQYRGQDHATNVLSFAGMDTVQPAGAPVALGDIVICGPVVAREAAEQGVRCADHWAHLLVHGALHLLGYDHETDAEALQMETLEARILAAGDIEDPYAGERENQGQS